MPSIKKLTWSDISIRCEYVANMIDLHISEVHRVDRPIGIYGIPRGGITPAAMIQKILPGSYLCEGPKGADIFIDDIIDSGNTRLRYQREYGGKPFYALVNPTDKKPDEWVSFPWERMSNEGGCEDAVTRLIQYIGDDPERDGLKETPARVIRSYGELFSGYKADPSSVLKTFEDSCDEMVTLTGIEFFSTCEHHMLPFIGKAHIAYIPDGKVVGISKLARCLEIFTRRLQIQERICQQVTSTIMEVLKPKGAACVLEAKHLCMTCRGVNKQESVMITSSLEGVFRKQEVREEFMATIRRV